MTQGLTISVNYSDELRQTLPGWKRLLGRVIVVTDYDDEATAQVALENNCEIFKTTRFYANGATFNKGGALEEARRHLFRWDAWIAVFDADIIAPDRIPWDQCSPGVLYGAPRMLEDGRVLMEREWPGYFWLFHGTDPRLNQEPWFTEWKHAGCYDSEFEQRWPRNMKVKFPFPVRHIGQTGRNWWGKGNDSAMEVMIAERKAKRSHQHERLGREADSGPP